jgi:sugar lactone lactonase YvrE
MKKNILIIGILLSTNAFSQTVGYEIFATVEQSVGNIAFTQQGDLVYSHHPFFNPNFRVVKYNAKTKTTTPFPNEEWNTPRKTDDHYLSNVLGIRNDENGIVWILDMGQRNPVTPKIIGWNTITDKLEHIYYLPATSLAPTSQPNDMVVDNKHGVFVIADEGIGNGGDGTTAALIVVDMKTGITRRLLQGSRTTLPENMPTVINGKPLAVNGKNLLVGCDGITADKNFEWLYYAPLNGSKMYRVRLDDLLNENLTEPELDKKIETYSPKPNNGGLSIDTDGNLYLTAMESNSIAVILAKDKSIHNIVTDEKLLWADGVSYNVADGYMYVSAAQVHLGAVFNNGKSLATSPFYIFRFKPLTKGVSYR